MTIKKLLALVTVLCVLIGCVGVTALAKEAETITVGEEKVVSVPACDEFLDENVYYSFTPLESGTYAFRVEKPAADDVWQGVWLYVTVDGEKKTSLGEPLMFVAEAGETYSLSANYWGEYTADVDYTFFVEKCPKLKSIELIPAMEVVTVGDTLHVDVVGTPEVYSPEEINWTVSDEAVMELSEQGDEYALFTGKAPGTVTLTATTASGKTASVEVTVEEPVEMPVLVEGENPVTLPKGESVTGVFTPEYSGYYTVTVDNDMVTCYVYADSVYQDDQEYHFLKAGEPYEVSITTFEEKKVDCTLTITYQQDVEILDPVEIEIAKKPNNTKYLKKILEDETYGDLLAGLELNVTWSDGSKTLWKYDDNYGMLGNYYLEPEIKEHKGKTYLRIHVPDTDVQPKSCRLTVVDLTLESIALADNEPLQIVENSCGIDLGSLGGWVYLPLAAYDREVVLTFSDGSTVNAKYGDVVYGVSVDCFNSQSDGGWEKGGDNYVTYSYGSHEQTVKLPVEIIDSPVESIELITPPDATFIYDDEQGLINRDGEVVESMEELLSGLSFVICYKDGTSKTVEKDDIEWRSVMGSDYPFVDGYPMGVVDGLLSSLLQDLEAPCEIESSVEYMGVTVPYTIYVVEEFAEPPTEPTEPPTEPTEPPTEPTEPATEPTEPAETEVTEPATTAPTVTEPQGTDDNPDTGDMGVYMFLFVMLAAAFVVLNKLLRVRTVK